MQELKTHPPPFLASFPFSIEQRQMRKSQTQKSPTYIGLYNGSNNRYSIYLTYLHELFT